MNRERVIALRALIDDKFKFVLDEDFGKKGTINNRRCWEVEGEVSNFEYV